MIDIGKLKENIYSFEDNGVVIYTNPIKQELLIKLMSKDVYTEEEKVEMCFKEMLSPSDYEKYKDEHYRIKSVLVADYLNWHRERLEARFPSTDSAKE